LTSSSILLMEEQVGDCGVDWHWTATLKDIRARTPRGSARLNPQTFNAFGHVIHLLLPLLGTFLHPFSDTHGFCSQYTGPCFKDILFFKTCISLAEAARRLREHLAPRIARGTLPKCSVAVPPCLVVVQASICPCLVLLLLLRTHAIQWTPTDSVFRFR
jgi:hypothetical protein